MRAVLLGLVLLFPVTLAGATCAWITLAPPWATGDPLLDDVHTIHVTYARELEGLAVFQDREDWPQIQQDWNARLQRELRATYRAHGKPVPAWLATR